MNKVDVNIANKLTPLETSVFELIEQIRKKRAPNTVVRVVGGWVRDKMLATPSDDIDLMVDNMSGEAFARIMAEEMGLKGPAVIKSNPEKTKNIETATMTIPVNGTDVELDFAQCRTEEYGDNRREVIVKPATAEEDAFRRDLTIGALFYNINERKVEDFTGKGLKDLITGTIRTPYDDGETNVTQENIDEVKKTFIEDPLRIFRAIRFAAKYNGDISPATKAALSDPEVINATFYSERKIATDRIGTELKKIFQGPNPAIGLSILKETSLLQTMLNESLKGTKYEGEMEELDMYQNNPHHELTVWGHTYQVLINMLEHFPQEDPNRQVIMVLAALTHDLGKLYRKVHGESGSHPGRTSYHGHEKESQEICSHLLRFLRFENDIIQQVSGLARYHMQPHNLGSTEGSMSAIRKFIRRMGEKSLSWLDVFNLSVADAYSKGLEIKPETIEEYKSFRTKLETALASMKMQDNSTKVTPVLNGHEIMQILDTKPGPHMKDITDFVNNLKDENPDITKEEASAKLIEKFKPNPESPVDIQASSDNESEFSTCSQHVFMQKMEDLQDLIDKDRLTEANSVLNSLKEKYGSDEKITRLIAINKFKCLTKNNKNVNIDLLQYVLNKASENFFDSVLNAYAYGMLIMTKTSTDNHVIKEVASRVNKLSPGTLRFVVNNIPKTKIVNTEAATLVKDYLDLNCRG